MTVEEQRKELQDFVAALDDPDSTDDDPSVRQVEKTIGSTAHPREEINIGPETNSKRGFFNWKISAWSSPVF